ncbi:MAG: universal stress protein [Gammaproteobacteria bacterium]|nr:universal stress protein [Gammaproteobacteria bacterium]
MTTSNSILVIIEPEIHPHEVIERAIWLARISNCSLDILLCDADVGPLREGWYLSNEAKEIGESIRIAQSEMIEDLADNARETGITVNTGVLEDRPIAEGILHRARETAPRYLMKGTQYHSAAERAIFVDTDWQLIRSCPCPLYLVKPKELRAHPVLLAAVDPTHARDKSAALDHAIVEHAQNIAKATEGEFHLVHSYQRISSIGSEATRTFKPIRIPLDELDKKITAEHRQKLDALADAYGVDAEHVHQLPGRTRELLPTFARAHNVDVVVMGALARWGLKRAVIGSTAERVLDHLPCDVLIVRAVQDEE